MFEKTTNDTTMMEVAYVVKQPKTSCYEKKILKNRTQYFI